MRAKGWLGILLAALAATGVFVATIDDICGTIKGWFVDSELPREIRKSEEHGYWIASFSPAEKNLAAICDAIRAEPRFKGLEIASDDANQEPQPAPPVEVKGELRFAHPVTRR